ncbi:hypothetical protein ASPZODRAFT_128655 [Penicilliopsis zonata CBS 506.65]|uniref:F-box domain-containing protein n=1 Tax=Penicilliopsis zonata CBS 506.65 TaxID=1073090 RepID=A0A1L9SS74_9EURO|nr:hypothetical protein ASPZODRAFT_128655 [Penicilliopsis zonata CBS 506.65]OJJ50058.1 hypothetical protein ASPZODRAFT_128655 [Penicilliopsis zonata CBS 506.65]
MAPVFHDSALALTSAEDERSHLLRLPSETLQNIFQRVEPRDLVSLSQVCRSFHELAAAELYRSIEHVFAEDDTRAGQLSVDRLAAILETLITSDYNYGRFIKKICMETATGVVSNDRSHRSLRHEASYTSAKLLSSLLLAALNRVDSLETFRWNVHLDINKSVFAALSKIPTLQNVHLRLPTEPLSTLSAFSASLAMAPHPHIPLSSSTQNNHPAHHHHHHHHHHHQHQNQHQHMIAPNLNYTSSSSMHPYFFPMSKMEAKGLKKVASLVPNSLQASALTQLTGLKSLAILDIHSLDSLADIARCISLSFSSLKSLKLSFSDPLALKARRRPTPISSASGSASETDDFGLNGDIMPPAPPVAFMNPPAPFNQNNNTPNANDAQVIKERATQDKALAQLLGLEKSMPQGHVERLFEEALASADKEAHEIAVQSDQHDEDRAFVKKLRQIAQDLPPLLSSGGSSTKSKKALEQIEKAAAKYLKYSPDDKSLVEKTASSFTNVNIDVANLSQTVATASADSKTSGKADDADGIDLEHPDEDGDPGDDQIFVENDTHAAVGAGNGMTRTLHLSEHKSNGESVQMDEAKIDKGKGVVREASETFATKGIGANCNAKAETAEIEEYMRKTRGISLDSLSIHLIPVRGSILCRTVDIYALKHLSLLNVGTQRSLWTMLLKLHQSSPLQLTSIHTDNVSPAFLSLVESLHKVTELFMFEPSSRAKVGSLAAKIGGAE